MASPGEMNQPERSDYEQNRSAGFGQVPDAAMGQSEPCSTREGDGPAGVDCGAPFEDSEVSECPGRRFTLDGDGLDNAIASDEDPSCARVFLDLSKECDFSVLTDRSALRIGISSSVFATADMYVSDK